MKKVSIDVLLPRGEFVEGEVERRGDKVRVRLRLIDAAGFVVEAFRRTLERARADDEPLPKEFAAHPEVCRAVFDADEEIWAHRLRLS